MTSLAETLTFPIPRDIPIVITVEHLAQALEVCDPEISDGFEGVSIALGGHYLVITAPDAVVAMEQIKQAADAAQVALVEAREEKAYNEAGHCVCRQKLDAGQEDCGSRCCAVRIRLEAGA